MGIALSVVGIVHRLTDFLQVLGMYSNCTMIIFAQIKKVLNQIPECWLRSVPDCSECLQLARLGERAAMPWPPWQVHPCSCSFTTLAISSHLFWPNPTPIFSLWSIEIVLKLKIYANYPSQICLECQLIEHLQELCSSCLNFCC